MTDNLDNPITNFRPWLRSDVPAALDNYKISASLISPEQLSKLPMKEALELIDHIQLTCVALMAELEIHQSNLKNLADIIRNSVSKK